jgi:hypothetical protein
MKFATVQRQRRWLADRPDIFRVFSSYRKLYSRPAHSINGSWRELMIDSMVALPLLLEESQNRSSATGGEPESMALLSAVVEPSVVPPTTRKESSMRKWGPAVLALGMALVMHAILFQNNQIPTATLDRSRRKLALISDRVAAMDRMEETFIQQLGLTGALGGRDRSGEADEPSIVLQQYTRRRHRYLGDQYTHHDVSDQFSWFGKISTSLIYFAFWVFLMFPNWPLPIGRPGIALGVGLSMIIWRYILLKTEHGPYFGAERVIIVEPLFLLFGLMLTTIYIDKMDHGVSLPNFACLWTTRSIGSAPSRSCSCPPLDRPSS